MVNQDKPLSEGEENKTSLTLLQRVRQNDQLAWDRLVSLYEPLVIHWCHRLGIGGTDADDIAQEVWIAAAKAIPEFRKERPQDSFRGWLFTIARHRMMDFFRRRAKSTEARGGTTAVATLQSHPHADDVSLADVEEESALQALHLRALELVRNDFESRTWQAFWRVVVDDRRPADVGADLDMSPNAVRTAKSRVLKRLREELGELIDPAI